MFAIIKCINGNFSVHAEGITDLANAKTMFHGLCQMLWNAPDVITAHAMIADEQLDPVEGYKEFIHHDPQPEEEEEEINV